MKLTALSQGAMAATLAAALEYARQQQPPSADACRADNITSLAAGGVGALSALVVAKVNGTPATAQVLVTAAIITSIAAQFGYAVAAKAGLPAAQRVLLIAALVGLSQYAAFNTQLVSYPPGLKCNLVCTDK
jgi:hypothetical protein